MYLFVVFALCVVYKFNPILCNFAISPSLAKHFIGQPTVSLVIAATSDKDLSWTQRLSFPDLRVVPYIANDEKAEFHPRVNKGNEAMMYLTYIRDFYDELADITIFTHGDEVAWHNDASKSMKWSDSKISQIHKN